MTGLMQRIFRRRASGSSRRGAGGLLGRLSPGRVFGRARTKRPPWGKKAVPPAPAGHDLQGTQETQVLVQHAARQETSFRDRGRLRRRLRFLRRARELAFRDIGGLMFDMRRFGRERPDLVEAKIAALAAVDQELRALERILDDRRPLHELREPGITSCARCGALHASDSNFCPNCGLQVGGPRAMGEVGGAIAAPPQAPPAPIAQAASPAIGTQPPSPAAASPGDQAHAEPPAGEPRAPRQPSSSTSSQPTEAMRPPRAPDDGA